MKSLERFVQDCDGKIRNGKIQEATKILREMSPAEIPRKWRLHVARLCRRTDLIDKGLRLMTPIIRSEGAKLIAPPTALELAEYAALLQRCGAVTEALRILESLDRAKVPSSFLFSAYCHFGTWNYSKATPCLEAYLANEQDPYQAFVGRVNLAAAYLATDRLEDAMALLQANIVHAADRKYMRLLANCHELLAQVYLRAQSYDKAETCLRRATEVLGDTRTTMDQLFIRKWQAIGEAMKAQSLDPLTGFRPEAVANGHAESVRETDLYRLLIQFNYSDYSFLYYGTPYAAYRERIAKLVNTGPPSEDLVIGVPGSTCLNLREGALSDGTDFPKGSKVHGIFSSLLGDLYRPKSTGELFSDLFPGEHFNIFTSPGRVHQLLYRSRKWLESEKIPVKIETNGGFHSLRIDGEFSVRLHLNREPQDKSLHYLTLLRDTFREKPFTNQDACARLDLSSTSVRRLTASAVKSGALDKFGAGKSTVYFFVACT